MLQYLYLSVGASYPLCSMVAGSLALSLNSTPSLEGARGQTQKEQG